MAQKLKFGNGTWATKEGSTLAYNDENGNYKPLPFSVSRASTATRVNKQGLIEVVGQNKARVDYSETSNGALLLEPSRTNSFLYSEDLSNAAWVKERISVSSDVAVAPDGTNTADKIVENTDNNSHRARQNANSTQGVAYAFSCYLKASERTKARLLAGGLNASADFDLSNGSVIGTPTLCTASIKSIGNGWYLCAIVYTQTAATSASQLHLVATLNDVGDFSYTGDGTSGLFVWGAQLEVGSYATSYIPTSGSSVTRVVDDIELAFPSTSSFSSNSGFTSVVEFGVGGRSGSSSSPFLQINDADGYMSYGSSGGSWRCRLQIGATAYLNTATNTSRDSVAKLGISCDSNGWSQCANGEVYASGANDASSLNVLSTITFLTNETYGQIKIRSLSIYNTRLSDSELESLTSI